MGIVTTSEKISRERVKRTNHPSYYRLRIIVFEVNKCLVAIIADVNRPTAIHKSKALDPVKSKRPQGLP